MKLIFLVLVIWHSVEGRFLTVLEESNTTQEWWKNAVIYQIYPRSFQDSDNNGIGDIKGIISRVDYLKWLGVNAVWLGPMYPSGGVDFGYDVTNMTEIDPLFGTMSDLEDLIKKLHDNGMKVIMDYVPNHTSDKHNWFLLSKNKTNPYTDYYIWRDPVEEGPPNNWLSVVEPESAWTFVNETGSRKQYYLHNFFSGQPDLNYANQDVIREMNDIMTFWIKKNVDGFRMDAVSWLCEQHYDHNEYPNPSSSCNDTYGCYLHPDREEIEDSYKQVKRFSIELGATKENGRIMFTESYNNDIDKIMKYFDYGVTFPMNMDLITQFTNDADVLNLEGIINRWSKKINEKKGRWSNWILGNHDQHRVGSRMTPASVDSLNMLVMFLNGTVITYMGEELGMLDADIRFDQVKDPQGKSAGINGYKEAGRDGERSPFQWNTTMSGGFSNVNNTWLPLSSDYWESNVELQKEDQKSHLNVYRKMVQLRSNFTSQNMTILPYFSRHDIILIIRDVENNKFALFIMNLGSIDQDLSLRNYDPFLNPSMDVYAASSNFDWSSSNTVDSHSIKLRPKAAVVLL